MHPPAMLQVLLHVIACAAHRTVYHLCPKGTELTYYGMLITGLNCVYLPAICWRKRVQPNFVEVCMIPALCADG